MVAISEIGLDFSYGNEKIVDQQIKVFNEMLQATEKLSLPVIVHSRRTEAETMSILGSFNLEKVLVNWFSGPPELLPKIAEKGYYVSEGPLSVYSSKIRQTVRLIPLSSLLQKPTDLCVLEVHSTGK